MPNPQHFVIDLTKMFVAIPESGVALALVCATVSFVVWVMATQGARATRR